MNSEFLANAKLPGAPNDDAWEKSGFSDGQVLERKPPSCQEEVVSRSKVKKSMGSTTSVSAVAETGPPMMTMARGF